MVPIALPGEKKIQCLHIVTYCAMQNWEEARLGGSGKQLLSFYHTLPRCLLFFLHELLGSLLTSWLVTQV